MFKVSFALEKRADENTGVEVDTLVKYTENENGIKDSGEPWGNVMEFDRLFDVCSRRWPRGWDLNKVMTAIQECDFD